MDAVLSRTSIRSYTEYPVSADSLQKMLQAAMAAHSAGDQRPWHFVVIEDLAVREQIPNIHPFAHMTPESARGNSGLWRSDVAEASGILGSGLRSGNGEHPHRGAGRSG